MLEIVERDAGGSQDFMSSSFGDGATMICDSCTLLGDRMPKDVMRSGNVINEESRMLKNFYKLLRRYRPEFTHERLDE